MQWLTIGCVELELINKKTKRKDETEIYLSFSAQNFRLKLPLNYQFPAKSGYYYKEDMGYGFLVNISHPIIEPYYSLFKNFCKKKSLPLDDEERLIFEADIICNLFRSEFEKQFAGTSKGMLDYYVGKLLKYKDFVTKWQRYRK